MTLPPVYAPTAIAHHGWSGFDQERPLYLEGRALEVKWRNPHAEVKLELSPELRLPADLASLPYPVQTAAVEGRALALRTTLPTRRDRVWDIELAPLPRLNQWRIEPIAVGSRIAVIGFTFSGERGDAVLRAEYLIVADRIYGLRSSPA
ncbi:MAG: hypothetical protein EBZ03_09330 [Betaproteobacteria bacterium]|nr:hypothetical protein [Pseudomonadota bacterium]NBQ09149.1 hypothetical protein [Betaproteobacteria bacterium]NCV26154.1 hypothetical protein [Betaproteobacteria bacterium]NCV32093.1 hypothetical protein [Betaproteobacteria bacterium]NCV56033.1 hypothetical protein [Betaproteobacteria bacterium]